MTPEERPFVALRGEMPKWLPRVNELLQLIGGGGFMTTPSRADLEGRFQHREFGRRRLHRADDLGRGRERVRLLHQRRDRGGVLGRLRGAAELPAGRFDELVEEGNVFEAGAVAGVEHADDSDEREVHTHEVPEDDVPEEYLDND